MDNDANLNISLQRSGIISFFRVIEDFITRHEKWIIFSALSVISIIAFITFALNGLGLAYNDARSHLDIGRRVVEGLKTGLAQLGSVWLPLPHFLMIFTIWNDFMWHSGLSGALISMISYVGTGFFIHLILKQLGVGLIGRLTGVLVFAINRDILYLQSTAMTELLLLLTWSGAFYELISWFKKEDVWDLVKTSIWIMLSTFTRYEGWFIFLVILFLVTVNAYKKQGLKVAEGVFILFGSLGGLGIFLWILWNYLIFGDPLYSFIGPYSAHAQQQQIYEAGELITKWHVWNSIKLYSLANYFTIGFFNLFLAFLGMVFLLVAKKLNIIFRLSLILLLLSPFIFNVLALFFGFSIISIVGVFGDNWFNVRYGTMMILSVAILIGYLINVLNYSLSRFILTSMIIGVFINTYLTSIPVTIEDALWGASSKNVSQVSNWLKINAKDNDDKIFTSAGSHDAIIFSSGLKMSRFVHEGTGDYWTSASANPEKFVRYIVMRTYDMKDATFYAVRDKPGFLKYDLVLKGEFADIYELKSEFRNVLYTQNVKTKMSGEIPTLDSRLFTSGNQSAEQSRSVSVLWFAVMFMLTAIAFFGVKFEKNRRISDKDVDGVFGSHLTVLRNESKVDLSIV